MPLFDPSNDWTVIDGLETIAYYVRENETTYSAPIISTGKKIGNEKAIQDGDEQVEVATNRASWSVWYGSMGSPKFIPKRGDKLTNMEPAGTRTWHVLEVDYDTPCVQYLAEYRFPDS